MNGDIRNHVCGLYYTTSPHRWEVKRTYLPQVQLTSHTSINPVCFVTKLTQTFHNPNNEALTQARYTFPLYDGVAVNGYTIRYASKVLKGVVQQKDVAKKTYQAAVDRGETAGLLESLPAGVFGVALGNVPANADIVVDITYCGELKHDASIDGLRYMLPTSIAPRYGSYPGSVLGSNTIAKGGISITVDVDMATSAIRKIQSPSHPIAVSMGATSVTESSGQAPFMPSRASATLTLGSTELAQDFTLQLLIDDISKPQAILETHPTLPNQRAIMTTLVPRFALESAHPEIVFVADQSGSMGGSKNAALVSALKIFLKSLPLGVRFNICGFGSRFQFLWPKSQAYNDGNLLAAIAFVDSFAANYGGTEILPPITAAFEQRLSDLPLEVMLLTDGEIWQEKALFEYVNEQIHGKKVDARVFALGIGRDVSHTLVEGVARAGNGFAQFVTQDEETDQKVVRMLKGALYAHTKDYELEVHFDQSGAKEGSEMSVDDDFELVEVVNDCLKITDKSDEKAEQKQSDSSSKPMSFFDTSAELDKTMKNAGETTERYAHLPAVETPKLLQAPSNIPPLFPFNRTTLYLVLGPDSAQSKVTSVTLRATSSQGPLELNIPVHYQDSTDVATIHQLAARKAIQDLEEGRGWLQAAKTGDDVSVKTKYESRFDELVERECVRLGEKFQVAGKWTSFVAVEDGSKDKMETDAPEMTASGRRQESAPGVRSMKYAAMSSMSLNADRRYVAPNAPGLPPRPSGSPALFGGGNGGAPLQRHGFFEESAQTGGLFGSSTASNTRSSNPFRNRLMALGGMSGQLSGPPAAGSASSCFGAPVSTPQNQSSAFGQTRKSAAGGLFGAQAKPAAGGLFANSTSTGNTSAALFGPSKGPTPNPSLTSPAAPTSQAFGAVSLTESSRSALPTSSSYYYGEDEAEEEEGEDMGFGAFEDYYAPYVNESADASVMPRPDPESSEAARPASMSSGVRGPSACDARAFQSFTGAAGLDFDDMSSAPQLPPGPQLCSAGVPVSTKRNRTSQPPRMSTGGMAPRKQLASKAAKLTSITPNTDSVDSADLHSDRRVTQTMHTLISLQTFSGAWAWTPELFSTLRIDEQTVSASEIKNDYGPEVCATLLAVAFLETKAKGKKDVWEMLVLKARQWVASQMGKGGDMVAVDELVEKAAAYF